MSVNIKVSFVSGFYNREKVVDRTLNSMTNQNHNNFEVICFDDNSTDGTYSELSKYSGTNVNIYRHPKNLGFTIGLIAAIKKCSGEYIAIQGSGDVADLNRLKFQSELLDSDESIGVVGSYYDNIVETSGLVRPRKPEANQVTLHMLQNANVFSHGEVMFRKSYYDEVGGYRAPFKFCQDYDLWLRMIKVSKFATVKMNLYHRYVQFDGVSYDPKKFIYQARYYIICQNISKSDNENQVKETLDELQNNGPESIISVNNIQLQKKIFNSCLRSIVWGNYKQAIELSGNLSNGSKQILVRVISAYFRSWFSWPLKLVLYRVLGINRTL